MVQQCGELYLPFLACRFSHTFQPVWPTLPALRPAWVKLFRVLLGQRPSLHDLLRPSPAFVRSLRQYYAVVRLPATVHVGLIAHRFLPPIRRLPTADGNGVSRFSRVKFLCMLGVYDSAEPAAHSRLRAPLCCLPDCVTPSALWIRYFGAHYFGIPSLHMPLSNASSPASRPSSHGSGSEWFA